MNKKIRVWIHNAVVQFAPKAILARLARCKEVARWLADKDDLTFKQRIELFFHLLYCPPCWVYSLHLEKLKEVANKLRAKEEVLSKDHAPKIDAITQSIINKHCK